MLLIFLICLHLKKDGTLDMRYKSSKLLAAQGIDFNDLHYKSDGTLDMRYKSSKAYVEAGGSIYGPNGDDEM